ncbi:MAG TPA: TIGR00341 family protein [Gammaproteobacteria bacterium]|nr:TIGR00341 family protein [Gammaproteobacteria bacterium]
MKIIEVIADAGNADTVAGIADHYSARDFRLGYKGEDGRQAMRLLVSDEKAQSILDALQGALAAQPGTQIMLIPVEAALPRPPEAEEKAEDKAAATREALYESIEKNARLDMNYMILVVLSTIVAAIGLIENNIAVVIGAMVIAPLLGPNLALALGTSLGDGPLIWKALQSNLAGLVVAVALSFVIGLVSPIALDSPELLARTNVGLDSVALALASGAAAVLSITTGLPSVLVGVMVAVALLPPAAALGLMLSSSQFTLATGAGLLLAVNIVCLNLSAKLVFLLRGVGPRTWWEKAKARRATIAYILVWVVSLIILLIAVYTWHEMPAAP